RSASPGRRDGDVDLSQAVLDGLEGGEGSPELMTGRYMVGGPNEHRVRKAYELAGQPATAQIDGGGGGFGGSDEQRGGDRQRAGHERQPKLWVGSEHRNAYQWERWDLEDSPIGENEQRFNRFASCQYHTVHLEHPARFGARSLRCSPNGG